MQQRRKNTCTGIFCGHRVSRDLCCDVTWLDIVWLWVSLCHCLLDMSSIKVSSTPFWPQVYPIQTQLLLSVCPRMLTVDFSRYSLSGCSCFPTDCILAFRFISVVLFPKRPTVCPSPSVFTSLTEGAVKLKLFWVDFSVEIWKFQALQNITCIAQQLWSHI